ncbi:hypothetical protein AAHA92_12023 [Salvia divinorum]|uniref:Trichome birefringence-like C-terminal domain-containing protein n=1 Tax=Salvia divinorum TaxID=28513 RepID=A0ABD1HJM5_SALDI
MEHVIMTMDVMEAFRRSHNTLKLWVTEKLDEKSHVFFRSYSPVHFRDGEWNKGGYCSTSNEPETDYWKLEPEPLNNQIIFEDYSHCCLPRVPDTWNQLLYAQLLAMGFRTKG